MASSKTAKVCRWVALGLTGLLAIPFGLMLLFFAFINHQAEVYAASSCSERAEGLSVEGSPAPGVPVEYQDEVAAAAKVAGVPPAIIAAQIKAESGWDEDAVSPAGALGLAQFMEGTWAQYGEGDPRDGAASIAAQGRYMKALMDLAEPHAGGDVNEQVRLALAAYNWGPGNMEGNEWKLDGIPAETANYIHQIPTTGQDWYTEDCAPVAGSEYTGPLGDGEWTHPLPGSTLTSGYGARNIPGLPPWAQDHVGLDFGTPNGGPVVAPTDIRITNVYDADGCVMAKATTTPEFGFAFCHLNSISVKTGDKIERGGTLGQEGTKATSVGTSVLRHLHFELYNPDAADPRYPGPDAEGVMDPTPILKAKGAL